MRQPRTRAEWAAHREVARMDERRVALGLVRQSWVHDPWAIATLACDVEVDPRSVAMILGSLLAMSCDELAELSGLNRAQVLAHLAQRLFGSEADSA